MKKINVLKRKVLGFLLSSFQQIKCRIIIRKDHNMLLYLFIFIMKNMKTFK